MLKLHAPSALLGATLATTGFLASPRVHLTSDQEAILGRMSLVGMPDGLGGQLRTLRISGCNLQVVNGLGVDLSREDHDLSLPKESLTELGGVDACLRDLRVDVEGSLGFRERDA